MQDALMRARSSDPITSHMAAAQADLFAQSHKQRILHALLCQRRSEVESRWTGDGLTAADIAAITGLSVVQIDRRLHELEKAGEARVMVVSGMDAIRGGFRVWEAV